MKKQNENTIREAVEWYSENRKIYKQLCGKVHNILAEILEINGVNIHAIFSRTKDIESFREKINDIKYNNPKDQITDLAGLRIICYVETDLRIISQIIEESFDLDRENSVDKSKLLGTDKVGYKSIHYVAKLKNERILLPEYKKFEDFKFEVQIRTILQHAWAEIEHDRNYKFSGELPDAIKRRFKLIAGTLELADREFDSIALEIDKINNQVEKATKEGNLDFEINTTTLKQFLLTKFQKLIPDYIRPFPDSSSEYNILKELKGYGITNLNDFNKIIPEDFITSLSKYRSRFGTTTYVGLIRHILIIANWEKYFENSYQNDWKGFSNKSLLEYYNVPLEKIKNQYNINI